MNIKNVVFALHGIYVIVNDIRNFVSGLAEASAYGFCKSRKQKFIMSFTINDEAGLLAKCMDKREKNLVSDFLAL